MAKVPYLGTLSYLRTIVDKRALMYKDIVH